MNHTDFIPMKKPIIDKLVLKTEDNNASHFSSKQSR